MRLWSSIVLCATLASCAPHASALHGTVLQPAPQARDFSLIDQHGTSFTLSQSHQATALYFGFTHCTDVCPQTLALLGKARAVAGLTPQNLRIVMVTVDPQHDSSKALAAFFRKVGVDGTGLTGTHTQLIAVYRAYGIAVRPKKDDIGHTDSIFLIDASGRLRELLDPQTPLKDVAADLRSVVD